MKTLAVTFFALSSIFYADASSLNSVEKFRRASFLLTGKPPKKEDLDTINSMSNFNGAEIFFNTKVDEYISSDDFVAKMEQRIDQLFRLRISYHGTVENVFDQYSLNEQNTMSTLIRDIVLQNKSWDSLLTEKEYKVFPEVENTYYAEDDARGLTDASFYAYAFQRPNLESEIQEYLDRNESEHYVLSPENEDLKDSLAGVLTTNRFYSRYPTTRINRNRKRAAAIFRIFLCDSMTPVLISSESENQDLLNLALGRNNSVATTEAQQDAKHGEDKSCQSCHYKLEPAADTQIGSGVFPNGKPAPGALVYLRSDGTMVNIQVNGVGQLGEAIVQQPEYASCQVNHFWNWFIGEDIPLSEARKSELVDQFNKLGRKPKDFVRFLVSQREFHEPPHLKEEDVRFSHVQPILKRCDSCHAKEPQAPTLSRGYPYNSNWDLNDFVLGQIVWASDLKETQDADYMPPKESGWKLEGYERDLVKAWIKGGAKDNAGQKTIRPDSYLDISTQDIALKGRIGEELKPSFRNTYRRYLNNFDLMNALSEVYGDGYVNRASTGGGIFSENYRMILGFSNPSSGLPLFDKPSPDYLRLLRKLHNKIFKSWMSNILSFRVHRGKMIGITDKSEIAELIRTQGVAVDEEQFDAAKYNKAVFSGIANAMDEARSSVLKRWLDTPKDQQEKQIRASIDFIYGKGLLDERELGALASTTLKALDKASEENGDLHYADAVSLIHAGLIIRERFITY